MKTSVGGEGGGLVTSFPPMASCLDMPLLC